MEVREAGRTAGRKEEKDADAIGIHPHEQYHRRCSVSEDRGQKEAKEA